MKKKRATTIKLICLWSFQAKIIYKIKELKIFIVKVYLNASDFL